MKSVAIKKEMHHAFDILNNTDLLKEVHIILKEKSKDYESELIDNEKKKLTAGVNNIKRVKGNSTV